MSISACPAVPTSWCWTSTSMPTFCEVQHHLGAQVLVVVHRRQREVALLVPRLVPEVVPALLGAGVPDARDRVDVVVALVLVLVEPDRVEDVELALRAPVARLRDARLLQVRLGLLRDTARVARVQLARHRVLHEAVQDQRRDLEERVDERAAASGTRSMSDSWISWKPRIDEPSNPNPSSKVASSSSRDRDREVLHQPGQVAEPKVDDLGAGVVRQGQHVLYGLGAFGHSLPPRRSIR